MAEEGVAPVAAVEVGGARLRSLEVLTGTLFSCLSLYRFLCGVSFYCSDGGLGFRGLHESALRVQWLEKMHTCLTCPDEAW